jgi:hypothetical protein
VTGMELKFSDMAASWGYLSQYRMLGEEMHGGNVGVFVAAYICADRLNLFPVKPGHIKCPHIFQKLDKPFGRMRQQAFALIGISLFGVADNAVWIKVRGHPAEGVRTIGTQMFGGACHLCLQAWKIARLVHAHQIRVQGQHDRGFDFAAMNAVGLFFRCYNSCRFTETCLVATASMRRRARNSVATIVISGALPP